MENKQLNILAVQAQSGDKLAHETILAHFLPRVYQLSNQHWYKLSNETHFEQSCMNGINSAIRTFDITKGNFSTQVEWRFRQALQRTMKRKTARQRGFITESLDSNHYGGDADGITYDVIDDLAVVDDVIIVNEKIALLAEDDSRKLAILNAWSNGMFNDLEHAEFLAKQRGGNQAAHRKYIQRFRSQCQRALA